MAESAPALVSTTTLWPASTSAFTPEGTIPTRDSWSFTSLGTPINIVFTCSFAPLTSRLLHIVIPSVARNLLFLEPKQEQIPHFVRNDKTVGITLSQRPNNLAPEP